MAQSTAAVFLVANAILSRPENANIEPADLLKISKGGLASLSDKEKQLIEKRANRPLPPPTLRSTHTRTTEYYAKTLPAPASPVPSEEKIAKLITNHRKKRNFRNEKEILDQIVDIDKLRLLLKKQRQVG